MATGHQGVWLHDRRLRGDAGGCLSEKSSVFDARSLSASRKSRCICCAAPIASRMIHVVMVAGRACGSAAGSPRSFVFPRHGLTMITAWTVYTGRC